MDVMMRELTSIGRLPSQYAVVDPANHYLEPARFREIHLHRS
jgi:hypothetical protein